MRLLSQRKQYYCFFKNKFRKIKGKFFLGCVSMRILELSAETRLKSKGFKQRSFLNKKNN